MVARQLYDRGGPGELNARLDTAEQDQSLAESRLQADQERSLGNLRKLDVLEKNIRVQEQVLETLPLRARIGGQISRLTPKVGDRVKAGDSFGRIVDSRSWVADVEVPELDRPRAAANQPVELRFPAVPGPVVTGRVVSSSVEGMVNDRGLVVFDTKRVWPGSVHRQVHRRSLWRIGRHRKPSRGGYPGAD